jgi:hypothetical protein
MQDEEIVSEGFWYSKYEQHLPKVEAGKPFTAHGVLVNLMYLLQHRLTEDYQAKVKHYEAEYQAWRDRTPLQDRVNNVGAPKFPGQDDELFPVQAYRGSSTCRVCGKTNGHREFIFGGYRWPEGYLHYVEEHNVEPSEGFKKMLGAAAMWLAHPPIRYQIEEGVDNNVVGVQRMVAADNIVLLHINTRCKRPKVTALGSDTIDDKDVPIIYIDTLDGADGDDTGIVLLEYAGWTVWSAQAVKYGVNVSLHSPDALFPKQEEDPDEA